MIRVASTRGSTLAHLLAPDHGAYWGVASAAVAVVASCILIPGLQRLFQFEVPSAGLVGVAMLLGVGSALLFDLAKLLPLVQRILGRAASAKTTQPGEAS